VECTTGIVAAFSEARKSKRLKGERSSVLGVLMLGAFTFRSLYCTKLLWNFVSTGRLQSIVARGGPAVAGLTAACITPLWLLNFFWAAKVWISGLKMVGLISKKAPAPTNSSAQGRRT